MVCGHRLLASSPPGYLIGCASLNCRTLSLVTRAPEVAEFLRKWDFAADSQVAAEAWMADNDATVDEAAIWFLRNDKVWTEWVPSEVAENVNAALSEIDPK